MLDKTHLFDPEGIVNSVLNGVKVAAQCGVKRQFRREDFTGETPYEVCNECFKDLPGEIRLHRSASWAEMLEVAWRARSASNTLRYTIKDSRFVDWA